MHEIQISRLWGLDVDRGRMVRITCTKHVGFSVCLRIDLTRDHVVDLLERNDIGKVSWNLKENCRGRGMERSAMKGE